MWQMGGLCTSGWGWAAVDMGSQWGQAGDHGCEGVAAGARTSMTHAKMCLLCQAGPVDECDQFGRVLTARGESAQRLEGGPVRCMLWHLGHQVSDVHCKQ